MNTYAFRFGPDCEGATRDAMSATDAVKHTLSLPGRGYVWLRYRKHWHIVGNYADGRAWNGAYQCVAADPADWEFLAKSAT